MVDDNKFLQGAQPACLVDRVVVGGPAQDVPGDGVPLNVTRLGLFERKFENED